MELTGGADCGALGGDEKSERVEEEVASGGSVRVERWVRPGGHFDTEYILLPKQHIQPGAARHR
jgi:hypothetical protein